MELHLTLLMLCFGLAVFSVLEKFSQGLVKRLAMGATLFFMGMFGGAIVWFVFKNPTYCF